MLGGARFGPIARARIGTRIAQIGCNVMTRLRRLAALFALPLLFVVALWAPIPKVGDPGIDHVVAQVHTRMPGWAVVRATDTWEGGYAVVASCGSQEMGFQVVPGHGLPPNDPTGCRDGDPFLRTRLHASCKLRHRVGQVGRESPWKRSMTG